MKTTARRLGAAILCAALLAGCSTSNQAGGTDETTDASTATSASDGTRMEPTTKTDQLHLAYVPVVMNTSYEMVLAGIKEGIDANGGEEWATLTVQAPSSNTATLQEQPDILEGLAQQDIDAIIMATEDQDAMLPYIEAASEKGIPIFLFNMSTISENDPWYVTCVTFDQYEASHQIGEWAVDHFAGKEVEVAVLEGFPGVVNTQRLEGFMDAIADHPNLKVVASQQADWTRAQGQTVTENILQAHPNVGFIYGLYDEMALGAVAAVKQANKLGQIAIAGYDNTADGRDSILAGELTVTVDTASKQMGTDVLNAVKEFVQEGKEVPREIMIPTTVYDTETIGDFDPNNYTYVPPTEK
ncbi:MAG: sugar ABC transporter substrate-binding protein [Propionibacteriaceae bacterium]|jgi:ribose transport system substrate-binding protein|nr:sugar ABC transporter substrate-binding protein [Propionibacteriaceae bacterium]